MRVIIAGGRNYSLTERDKQWLDEMHQTHRFSAVVCGEALGADTGGKKWAISRNIPVHSFPAKWNDLDAPGAVIKTARYGRQYNVKAGFDRNEEMAKNADALIAFPGGSGTAHMIMTAEKYGLRKFGRVT